MSLFDVLGSALDTFVSKANEFKESERGQEYLAASRAIDEAKGAMKEMNKASKEMDELLK